MIRSARPTLPEDHPRSRGGYAVRATGRQNDVGSSPLARGLRQITGDPIDRRRIIPARAGFTRHAVVRYAHSQDHPRSRGVYHARRIDVIRPDGSSPLARGLLFRHERNDP